MMIKQMSYEAQSIRTQAIAETDRFNHMNYDGMMPSKDAEAFALKQIHHLTVMRRDEEMKPFRDLAVQFSLLSLSPGKDNVPDDLKKAMQEINDRWLKVFEEATGRI